MAIEAVVASLAVTAVVADLNNVSKIPNYHLYLTEIP